MIRPLEPDDIAIFHEQQDDPVASEMSAFPVRDRATHDKHWARILGSWIGRQHCGRGYATQALAEYVAEVRERPLHARVAEHNVGSIRVLAKCGFAVVGRERRADDPVTEIVLRLDARAESKPAAVRLHAHSEDSGPGRR